MASPSSAAAAAVGRAVEEVRSALNVHADVVAELFGRVSTELRARLTPPSTPSLLLPRRRLEVSGVFLAEKLNTFLGQNWKSFSSQNYFDPQGLFISAMWFAPLLLITILIMVNTLVMLCMLMVRWKRAELKHRAREARNKQE
uniref:Uncharacterized protein n=1 Tax=Avena sativa TaxID=4498 RepID=A0ACD6AI45_AVESA